MISLRTIEGMDLQKVNAIWGGDKVKAIEKKLSSLKYNNFFQKKENIIQLTDEGMLMADGIAADLFSPYPSKEET